MRVTTTENTTVTVTAQARRNMKYASFVEPIITITTDTPESRRGFLSIDTSVPEKLTLRLEGSAASLTVNASELAPRTKYIFFESPLLGIVMAEHDSMFKSKDQWAFRRTTEVLSDPVANLYFHDNWESSLFFSNIPPVSEEAFTTVDHDTYIHDWIGTQYAVDEYTVGHNTNARLDAFREVSTIDSIVALEQQVDLLQDVVRALLKGEVSPEWAERFLDETAPASCTEVRAPTDVIEDVVTHKTKVRKAQTEFFANRR